MRILAATSSDHKLREIRSILQDPLLEIVGLEQAGVPSPPAETGQTFEENARLKATYYKNRTGLPSLADDSGLVVDALGGAPGIHSARFASTDEERIERLLACLDHLNRPGDWRRRSAHFVCAMCLDLGDRKVEVVGSVDGIITMKPMGRGGFGYDPVFYYPPLDRTFGELSAPEKNHISHRAQALQQMKVALDGILGKNQRED